MMRSLWMGLAGTLCAAGTLMAQSLDAPRSLMASSATATFEDLQWRARPGEMVYVVDPAGHETRGRVVMVSRDSLTLQPAVSGSSRTFRETDIGRIERRQKDSVVNGVLIGAGAGALAGYRLGKSMDSPNCPGSLECGQGAMVGAVGGAVWGALGGWLVDTLIRKRETIYLAPGSK